MKINHRRKEKWIRNKEFRNESYSEFARKMIRREKHICKNRRLHQYHNLRELFDDFCE